MSHRNIAQVCNVCKILGNVRRHNDQVGSIEAKLLGAHVVAPALLVALAHLV